MLTVDRRGFIAGATLGPLLAGSAFARSTIGPFQVAVPQVRIDDIRRRVADTRLPRPLPPNDWTTGMDTAWLAGLPQHWLETYEWRAAEADLNRYPQFMMEIEGLDIHFYHVRGEGLNAPPLILTHGWPGSVREFLDVIGPLTHPSRHGGQASDAFSVVVPSLPGFAFSSPPPSPIQAVTTARLWHQLMTRGLGYDRYFAQGGDIGYGVTVQLAQDYPQAVRAIHLNLALVPAVPAAEQTPEIREWMAEADAFDKAEMDYLRLQSAKPMLVATALAASPMATAAWIAEKFWAWADHGGDLNSTIARDDLLTNIMLYLVTDAMETSLWFYRGIRDEMKGQVVPARRIEVPTAVAQFPKDYPIGRPPRVLLEQAYNLVHFTEMPRGGHFAAFEQPALFVEDLRSAFRPYRT